MMGISDPELGLRDCQRREQQVCSIEWEIRSGFTHLSLSLPDKISLRRDWLAWRRNWTISSCLWSSCQTCWPGDKIKFSSDRTARDGETLRNHLWNISEEPFKYLTKTLSSVIRAFINKTLILALSHRIDRENFSSPVFQKIFCKSVSLLLLTRGLLGTAQRSFYFLCSVVEIIKGGQIFMKCHNIWCGAI